MVVNTHYCSGLTAIVVAEGNSIYNSRGGCNAIIETNSNTLIAGCSTTIIPDGVTRIEDCAFGECTNLTAISLPASVMSIGNSAFEACSSLATITIPENSQLTSIGEYAFVYCESLTAITIPESVTSIGAAAFGACSSLTAITIPEGVTSIGEITFQDCSSLKEVTFGKGLKKIESGSFTGCSSIEKVTIHATQPPATDGNIFDEAVYEKATLYVPQGSIVKYQVMTGWSGFYNISEIESGAPAYLTLRQADNGEVGIAVDLGRTYKVRITPSTGWKIHTVTFNGEDVTSQLSADNTFTTPTLTASAVLNVAYVKEGSAINNAAASKIAVRGHNGIISISGVSESEAIAIYTLDGAMVASEAATAETTSVEVPTQQVYIVKVADKVVKIGM